MEDENVNDVMDRLPSILSERSELTEADVDIVADVIHHVTNLSSLDTDVRIPRFFPTTRSLVFLV